MKRFLKVLAVGVATGVVALGLTSVTPAAAPTSAAAAAARVPADYDAGTFLLPFLDDQTIAVGHLDVFKMNTQATEAYVLSVVDGLKLKNDEVLRSAIKSQRAELDAVITRFREAGGRHIFWLLHHDDLEGLLAGEFPKGLLFPVENGGNAAALAKLLPEQSGWKATVLRPDVVFYGDERRVKRMQASLAMKRAAKPVVNFGVIPYEGPQAEVLMRLSADERRALADLLPDLPALSRDLGTVHFSASMLGGPRAALTVDVDDGQGALKELTDVALSARDWVLASDWAKAQPGANAAPEAMRALLKEVLTPVAPAATAPGGAGPRQITFELTVPQFTRALQISLTEELQALRRSAHARATQDLYTIMRACDAYTKKHAGMFPESLDVLVQEKLLPADKVTNSADAKHRPYVFHTWPAGAMRGNEMLPVVWEQQDDASPGGYVGVMKLPLASAAQWVDDRAAVEAMVKKAEERVKAGTGKGP